MKLSERSYGNKFGPDMNWFFDQTLYGTGFVITRFQAFQIREINTTCIVKPIACIHQLLTNIY